MNVDVILPVYRGRRWLREAVGSVFAQTWDAWHLWIVDDASPDDSLAPLAELCRPYAEKISVLRLHRNRGAAAARMHAVERSSATAIAFLDQDDRWHPNKLGRQIQALKTRRTAAAVHCDVLHIDEESCTLAGAARRENALRARVRFDHLAPAALTRQLFLRNVIRLGSALVLRSAFEQTGGFRTKLRGGEDWEFWVRFATQHAITHLAHPLLERRIHAQSTSHLDAARRSIGALDALRLVEEEQPALRPLGKRRRSLIEQKRTIRALRTECYSDARRSAWALARLRPLDWRALALLFISSSGPLRDRLVRSLLGE